MARPVTREHWTGQEVSRRLANMVTGLLSLFSDSFTTYSFFAHLEQILFTAVWSILSAQHQEVGLWLEMGTTDYSRLCYTCIYNTVAPEWSRLICYSSLTDQHTITVCNMKINDIVHQLWYSLHTAYCCVYNYMM